MLLGATLGAAPLLEGAAGLGGGRPGGTKETDAGGGREAEEDRTGCTTAGKPPFLLRLRCRLDGAAAAAATGAAD